jgi:quercetin dioxygenase-like cupin family protein
MMMVEKKTFGALVGAIYLFEEIGDKLPMHNHDENSAHLTFVMNGSFRMHGDEWEIIAKTGQVIDWKPGQAHEFVALEPNSRVLNIAKGV